MMRAKMYVTNVEKQGEQQERIDFTPVTSGKFSGDGVDEDNTYSRYTPSGSCSLTITNPTLIGRFTRGQTFYVDFTEVQQPVAQSA